MPGRPGAAEEDTMRRTALLLALALALCGPLAAKGTILKVKVRTANVRSAADAAAPVIARVGMDTLLETLGRDGAWYRIRVTNDAGRVVAGFIHNSVVEVVDQGGEERAEPRGAGSRQEAARELRPRASGGPKLFAGLSLAGVSIPQPLFLGTIKGSRTGFAAGAGFETGGRLALELDLMFAGGGAVFKMAAEPSSKKRVTFVSSAVFLPVLVKARFFPGTTPYLLAGGEAGYLLSHKTVSSDTAGNEATEDNIAEVNRLLFGLTFGGGVELRAGGMDLLLEARYRIGLNNMIKEPEPGESMKYTALMFTVAARF